MTLFNDSTWDAWTIQHEHMAQTKETELEFKLTNAVIQIEARCLMKAF